MILIRRIESSKCETSRAECTWINRILNLSNIWKTACTSNKFKQETQSHHSIRKIETHNSIRSFFVSIRKPYAKTRSAWRLLIEYTCVCVSLCMHKHTKYALCNSLRRCIQKIRSKCVRCLLSHCYEILVTWFDHQFAKWFSDYILIISDHFI